MRKISFRGKAKNKGNTPDNWVYGGDCVTPMGNTFIIPNTAPKFNSKGEYEAKAIEVCFISQSTGLNDKHGREIYNGDILAHNGKVIGHVEEGRGYCFKVVYAHPIPGGDKDWSLYYVVAYDYEGDVEIVGNIYDNPEMVIK